MVLAACGGGGSDESIPASASTASTESTEVSAEASTDTPSNAAADTAPAEVPDAVAAADDADDVAGDQTALDVADAGSETLPDENPTPESQADLPTTVTAETDPNQVATAATTTSLYHLYVATNGSDSNPGTKTRPFKTILKASSVAKPGTTVHVAPGNYAGGFSTSKSGTASARIAYVSDVKWGAKIVPPASSKSRRGWINSGKYVDIIGFEVDGSNYQGGLRWWIGLGSNGANSTVQGNKVHHIATQMSECQSNGGAGITGGSTVFGDKVDILNNVVYNVGPAYISETNRCIWFHGIYFQAAGNVKNNVAYNNGYSGIALSHDVYKANVANNTVANNGTGIHINGAGFYRNPYKMIDYVNVSNNIAVGNKRYAIRTAGSIGTHNTYTNNLSYNNAMGNLSVRLATPTSSVVANPQFANPTANDFRLKSTSPAINKGLATYAPTTDILGVARPQGGRHDIGAYEYAY